MYFNPNMFNERGYGCGCCGETPCNPCVLPGCPPKPHCAPNIQPNPVIMPTREQVSHRQVAHEQPIITPIDNRTVTHHVFTPRYYVTNSFSQEDVIEANPFASGAAPTLPFTPMTPSFQMGPMTQTQNQFLQNANTNTNTNNAQLTNIINRNVF